MKKRNGEKTLQTRLIFKHDKQIKYNTTTINGNKHTGNSKIIENTLK